MRCGRNRCLARATRSQADSGQHERIPPSPSGVPVPSSVVFLSTYPPRRCGIATFARDLRTAVGGGRVVVVRRPGDEEAYPSEVVRRIDRDTPGDYAAAAAGLGWDGTRIASIQHEYGIFGGPDGANVLEFVDAVDVPVVTTLHTVVPHPTASQRSILARIVERSAATVVMSLAAARLIRTEYGGSEARIEVVHHGVPDLQLGNPDAAKARLSLAGRKVILSFGLLGPGKGYEHMIDAMDRLRHRDPEALFVVLGATHPDLVRAEG